MNAPKSVNGTGQTGQPARLVTLGAVRSAGVSTTALAVACACPTHARPLVVEGDPAGGTLAAALGLPAEPGLASVAAAARRDRRPGLLAEHAQPLPCGVRVVAGPPSAERARAALRMAGDLPDLLTATAADGDVVVADCGRLDPDGPSAPLFAASDLALLVTRPQLPDLHALAAWLDTGNDHGAACPADGTRPGSPAGVRRLGLVLCGPGPYGAGEVTDALGVDVLGALPWDPAAVAGLGQVPGRRLRSSAWWRAATALAGAIVDRLADDPRTNDGTAGREPSEPAASEQPEPAAAQSQAWASDRMPGAAADPIGRTAERPTDDGIPAGRRVGVR